VSVLEHPDVAVSPDVRGGTWTVDVPAGRYSVRRWTWGERRHLLDACGDVANGKFDRRRFARTLCNLVVEPPPAAAPDAVVLAAVALRLLGADPDQPVLPLLDAEALFARSWRWGPAELDGQPADRLDRHGTRLAEEAQQAATAAPPRLDDGWTSIVVDDGG